MFSIYIFANVSPLQPMTVDDMSEQGMPLVIALLIPYEL